MSRGTCGQSVSRGSAGQSLGVLCYAAVVVVMGRGESSCRTQLPLTLAGDSLQGSCDVAQRRTVFLEISEALGEPSLFSPLPGLYLFLTLLLLPFSLSLSEALCRHSG